MPVNFGELVNAQRKAVEARTRMAAKQRSRAAIQLIDVEEIAEETPSLPTDIEETPPIA